MVLFYNSGKQTSSRPDTLTLASLRYRVPRGERAALAKSSCSGAETSPACYKTELQNKTKLQDFYGRDFVVTEDTLIPRPETEMIVDAVLNLAGKAYLPGVKPSAAQIPANATILDVGTGSGCIAVTLKLELPQAKVIASDISKQALAVAQKNAEKFGAEVDFQQADLLDGLKIEPDVIVANLPYVDKTWEWLDLESLAREPALALFAEDGGLKLIKKLIDTVPKSTKFLILEADPCQHAEIIKYAASKNLELVETRGFVLVFNYYTPQA